MITQGPNKIILSSSKKKNKKTEGLICWLDMDGVVAFWEKSAAESLGVDLNNKEIREKIKNGQDMNTFTNSSDDQMWEIINKGGQEWWRDIELLPWSHELVEKLKEITDHFCFLTSPSNNPVCAAGKIEFLKKHFGDDFKDFMIGRNKELCASSRSILIDDNKKKVDKFRKFGGHAFLWPNPLTLIDEDQKVDDVIEELIKYINELKK
jgi:5'(3')-deoxyribonucleotidase